MAHFILIHGAWHASWCWKYVANLLQQKNHSVSAIDLPGRSSSNEKLINIDLNNYVQAVINHIREPVILVGHSMGGVVMTQVAEIIPDKIQKLIYVTAFIPDNQGSLSQEAEKFKTLGVSTEIIVFKAKNEIALKNTDKLKTLFLHRCALVDARFALARFCKEPFLPFVQPVHYSTTKFGNVKKTYITCTEDRVISLADQLKMAQKVNATIYLLDADHSPFFSAPERLVELMLI